MLWFDIVNIIFQGGNHSLHNLRDNCWSSSVAWGIICNIAPVASCDGLVSLSSRVLIIAELYGYCPFLLWTGAQFGFSPVTQWNQSSDALIMNSHTSHTLWYQSSDALIMMLSTLSSRVLIIADLCDNCWSFCNLGHNLAHCTRINGHVMHWYYQNNLPGWSSLHNVQCTSSFAFLQTEECLADPIQQHHYDARCHYFSTLNVQSQ